jgi:hypothetical protein
MAAIENGTAQPVVADGTQLARAPAGASASTPTSNRAPKPQFFLTSFVVIIGIISSVFEHATGEYRRLSSSSVGHGDNRDRLGVCPRQRWTTSSILVMRRNKFEFFRLLGFRIWSADQKSKTSPVSWALFDHPCGTAIPLSSATTSA